MDFDKELHDFILKHEMKRLSNIENVKRYHKTPKGREKNRINQRKYYYRSNDIYHPEFNVDGSIERKFKKEPIIHDPFKHIVDQYLKEP